MLKLNCMSEKVIIPIVVPGKEIHLTLSGESFGATVIEKDDASDNAEARFQIKEGFSYEYKLSTGFNLAESEIVTPSRVNPSSGRISPNVYVGTLSIDVLDSKMDKCATVALEVQSVKARYRDDYRYMLEAITERCTDLLLLHSSLVSQSMTVNFDEDSKTLYQRFAFIKSILDSVEFIDAVHKVISAPVTKWKDQEIVKDVRGIRRLNNSVLRQFSSASNRIGIPDGHPLSDISSSIPSRIKLANKTETIDTPENRFIKHALSSFLSFSNEFKSRLDSSTRSSAEAKLMIDKLEQVLSNSIFKEIDQPSTLPLNSPILQRKEGYREILRVWLMFDLAAKILWKGGDDVYSGNKRDVAVLYEYWIFFRLLDIISEVFKIKSLAPDELIEKTNDGLGLKLKQGKYLPLAGIYDDGARKLNVQFSYNKTFRGGSEYPHGGSWTRDLRPDYTLSIWPHGVEEEEAEREELIVHIHFDAKYKIESLQGIFKKEEDLDSEREEQNRGTYKRADLLKMHTYKDAIRRTAGAYILYPGSGPRYTKFGFHEIIPGLGAFSIRPSRTNDGGEHLKRFLGEVLVHFSNRASQREKMSLKMYETFREKPDELFESLPETIGINRGLIPDETFILIGYYRKESWEWIIENGLYNARAGSGRGSLRLGPGEAGAKYLVLHSDDEIVTNKILKIKEVGPRVFSKETLIERKYPSPPTQPYYLVYNVEELLESEMLGYKWDLRKLESYRTGHASGLPFAVTLTELMKVVVK
jgi:predicted component of viral defense system (DUF524 family)